MQFVDGFDQGDVAVLEVGAYLDGALEIDRKLVLVPFAVAL